MRNFSLFFLIVFAITNVSSAQSYKILDSNTESIKIEFNFRGVYQLQDTLIESRVYQLIRGGEPFSRKPGEPWVPEKTVNIAVPFNSNPVVRVLETDKRTEQNKLIVPFPEEDPQTTPLDVDNFDKKIYYSNKYFPEKSAELGAEFILRYSRIMPLTVAPYQYNPVTHELIAYNRILVVVTYNAKKSDKMKVRDDFTDNLLKSSVINSQQALQWTAKDQSKLLYEGGGGSWYDPGKNYFKIYLKNKGVYRLTFDQLVASGVPIQAGVSSDALEMVNEGNSIPIDVVDGGDGIFNSGDYLQFVGGPPSPSPNSSMNIYNTSNVYWFSYQSDTLAARYNLTDGYPNSFQSTCNYTLKTLHFEKDSIYEPLGHADNGNMDHWYWDKITGSNGHVDYAFTDRFDYLSSFVDTSHYLKVRVNLTGMNTYNCSPDHKAFFFMNTKPIGVHTWDGQSNTTFEKQLYISGDSIPIFFTGNSITVQTDGTVCNPNSQSDEQRMNWYELEYWRFNRTLGDHFDFYSPPNKTGVIRFWVWQWTPDNMKVYIPSKNKCIYNPRIVNDPDKTVLFVDTVSTVTEYYCNSNSYFLTPDSIVEDSPSDLKNPANGADYIIITHPDFLAAAQRLKTLRESQYPDTGVTNPRVMVVDVNQIYDEFSYGLLNPQSLRDFVRYAFENYQSPAPAYVVLFGDMSHDYRHLLPTSRPNFIPSLPFFADTYGEAQSDNLIVDVAGNDLAPDLAIGRMSCETPQEADVLMDKLENYPADNSKEWKQDVMLAASGLSYEDELHFHFNQYSNRLADIYLIPYGIHPSRVYHFPSNAQDSMYIGAGLKIREEIDQGVVLGNYYGHGGGYQWDLTFTNDDIAALNNTGRLPVILSVTCYTAHFDDQNVFGEQFNELPEKGSIGFFGNTVLTYWPIGAVIDEAIFNQIFKRKVYTIGQALLNARLQVGTGGLYGQQITLLTYLGDPGLKLALPDKPDFSIKSSDITLNKINPLVNDTVSIKAKISNLGIVFPNDTVSVRFTAESPDTSYEIATVRLPSFGELDSAEVNWIPQKAALYSIKVDVNEVDIIPEDDHSDNTATATFTVYNVSEAYVLKPQDGYTTSESKINFKFIDIGDYINFNLTYYIEIDTAMDFSSPVISSGALTPANGILSWESPVLPSGSYLWRVRIFDGTTYGQWSKVRFFTVSGPPVPNYYAIGRGFKTFKTYNINYSDSSGDLYLNTKELPPKPDETRVLDTLLLQGSYVDSLYLTTITTDGSYIYSGANWYASISNTQSYNSHIYKFGTGYNGTVKGQYYGTIPNFYDRIQNSLFYADGFLYVTTPDPYKLVKIDPVTGDTTRITIPNGLLDFEHARPVPGSFYAKSDGRYIYNLTAYDSSGHHRYALRILDPQNNWALVQPYMELQSSTFTYGFTDYLVADGYIYPSESYLSNYIRRIKIADGTFEEEWICFRPFQSIFSWCYDSYHDKVYAGVYRKSGYTPKFFIYKGTYSDSKGTISSNDVGPASKWKNLSYDIYQNNSGSYRNILFGLNRTTKKYDTLAVNIPSDYSLQNISTSEYQYLKFYVGFTDTTFNTASPMRFRNMSIDYDGLPEVMVTKKDFTVSPDSILQGLNTTMRLDVKNVGFIPVDSVNLHFFFNDSDSSFFDPKVNILPDSTVTIEHTFSSTPFIFDNIIRLVAISPEPEYFTFDNAVEHSFYIVRDSTNPVFNITFDGKEIINGDLVSAKPQVVITLKDNSPLPLDTSYFTLIHTSDGTANILHFSDPDLEYSYTPYPNSESRIIWHPSLKQGDHILEILAKDASGNFFDSTSYRVSFEVVTEYDLRDVYNYPNPFIDGTWFTFKVTGDKLPDELYLRIYTVAGRLIRTLNIPSSALGQDIGFKKVFWDGKDEDGDDIANGVYFYKMIYKVKDVVKSVTKKLAKIK